MQITPLINSLQNSRYFFAFFKRETVEWSAGHAPSPIACVYALAFAGLKHAKK